MRLLDRYQLRELLSAFAYCLVGILVFWMSFELLGDMERLSRRNLGIAEMLLYLVHRLPLFLVLQIPVTLLLSLLYVLTRHARHNELIAMRAAGLSLWRISLPYFVVGVLLSIGMAALNEYAVPDAAARAEAVLLLGEKDGDPRTAEWKENLNFRDESGRIWFVSAFNMKTSELRGAHIQWSNSEGGREEVMAERGRWDDGSWIFEGVTRLFPPSEKDPFPTTLQTNLWVATGFPETPAHLRSEVKISTLLGTLKKSRQVQLSIREILRYRELHQNLSPELNARLKTWFHDRLATPWTCLVVVLIGIPAAAGSARRNVFIGVAGAIFIAFAFFVLKEFSLATGAGGYLPPWLAAWLPNLLFAGAGLLAIQRVR